MRRQAARPSLLLADRVAIVRRQFGYAIPYYTRGGGDTEYLISNPNGHVVTATLFVFGRACRVVKKLRFRLKPHCTRTLRLRPIAPEHAAHSILLGEDQLIVHLLYLSAKELAVVGGELAGLDNVLSWRVAERARTYGFGYRALPLGHQPLDGAVFVSNPNGSLLTGILVYFDQQCRPLKRHEVAIRPGCTAEYPFPPGRFGYGLVQVSRQPVINVLHYPKRGHVVAAAELVGEANRVQGPAEPPPRRRKILFDDTHGCRPGLVGDWTDYEAALTGAGCTVAHHTAPTVTLAALQRHDVFVIAAARSSYSSVEKTAVSDFVNAGGGLLIVQDFGNAPWSVPTREMLNLFGTSDDNNFMEDPTHHFLPGQIDDVVFDGMRNFLPHPILTGVNSFHVDAAASLSSGGGWTTVAETDDDSSPARRPATIARGFGVGRIVAFGDSNTWANHLIANLDNRKFGVRCAEWLLFRF
ncbi:MAG: DUF4350 domain-containing protein [Candidatus Rokuibacteriota bacterium]